MFNLRLFIEASITLLVIMDPPGTVPVFLGLVGRKSREARKRAARQGVLVSFLVIETRAAHPLMPLSIFRHRTLAAANVMGMLMAAGLFAAFFLSALYMQLVLGYTPLEVGFAYLPQTLIWGGVSLFLSDKLVMRYGIRMPIVLGFPAFALECFTMYVFVRTVLLRRVLGAGRSIAL